MPRQYSCQSRARQGMRKRSWPMRAKASARKITVATKIALASTGTPAPPSKPFRWKIERPLAAGSSLSQEEPSLRRLLILGRPGIEVVLGGRLLGAVELQDRVSPHFPHAALNVLVLFVGVLAATQFAFDKQMRALLQRVGELAELSPHDDAVPLGVRDVLARLLVLVGALGGKREDSVGRLVLGGSRFRVLAGKAHERNSVLVHTIESSVSFSRSTRGTQPGRTRGMAAPKCPGLLFGKGTHTCFGGGVRESRSPPRRRAHLDVPFAVPEER